MAKYRKLFPRIWTDERFARFTRDEKLLTIYCLTCRQCNRIGIYQFSPALASEELGLTLDKVNTVLDTLCDRLSWKYDKANRVLYFPTWWKYNKPDNPKAMIGYLTDLDELPQTPLLQDFASNVDGLSDTVCHTLSEIMEYRIANGMAYTETEIELETEKEKEPEKDTETETETDSTTSASDVRPKKKRTVHHYSEPFQAFWQAVPKHKRVEKPEAQKEWGVAGRKIRDDKGFSREETIAFLQSKMEEYAGSDVGKTKWAKDPKRWLSKGKYDDDPEAWKRRNGDDHDTDPRGNVSTVERYIQGLEEDGQDT